MKKVVFVSSHAQLGGSERYLSDLVIHRRPDGVERVLCLASGPLVARLREAGIEVDVIETSARAPSFVRSALRVRRVVRQCSPDVVHANGVKAALVCALGRLRVPVVWAKHDFSWDGLLTRILGRRCAIVVGVSRAVLGAVSGARTKVVMPGLPPQAPDPASGTASLQDLVDEVGAVVVLVGRIHPVKGHRELIEAAPAIKTQCPDARFLFVGGQDPRHAAYAEEMSDLAKRRIGAAAVWAGYRSDLTDLLAACAVAVIVTGSDGRAPRGEGFGYVALEAMAAGTPVVAYANGAVPEVVGDCALLVAAGDRSALVASVVRALKDHEERKRAVTCGRARVTKVFALDRFVADMERVYEAASA